MCRKLIHFTLLIAIVLFSNLPYAEASTVKNIYVNIESSVLSATKNQKAILLNLNIDLPENWYTYYKNPGDIGVKTKVTWNDLPKSVEVSPIKFPIPEKHTEMGLTNYIYHQRTVTLPFLLDLTNYEDSSINLKGKAEFLVCHTSCIPVVKTFNKKIKVTKTSYKNSKFNYSIYNNIPKTTEKTNFLLKNGNVYIKLNNDINDALFIPNKDETIDDSAKQNIVKIYGDKYLQVPQDEYSYSKNINNIQGLILTNKSNFKLNANHKPYPTKKKNDLYELLLVALFALLGGMLLNLMPCVLPIIGLKIFSLIKHETPKQRIKAVLIYSAGIFVSMMLMVVLLLILKSLGNTLSWGFQLQNTYFVLFLIILLTLVGLDLLGVISLGNYISRKSSTLGNKYSGEFFAGFLTSVIASSCSAPFMGVSIGFALASDSNIITLAIFTFFALGMALPLILIAVFPKAHKIIPKPGAWMNTLKKSLSIPIFATAIWLLSIVYNFNFISDDVTHLTFSKEKIEQLNLQDKAVFVDFSAKWCITCKYNQLSVIHTKQAQQVLKDNGYIYMVADWTKKDAEITKELTSLKQAGVPTYAVYLPNKPEAIILPNILTMQVFEDSIKSIKK